MKALRPLVLVAILSLAGCNSWFKPKPKPIDHGDPSSTVSSAGATVDSAIGTVDAAKTEEAKATDLLLGKLKANVSVARTANKENPEGQPRTKVDSELGVAESRLEKVTPDAVEMAEAAKRLLLIEQGKSSEARAAYDRANEDARKQAGELAKLRHEYELAVKDRDTARAAEHAAIAKYEQQMQDNKRELEAQIARMEQKQKDALDAAHNEFMREQARWLNIAGFVFLAAFGVGIGFGGLPGLKNTFPFAILAVICFGLAQIVSQPWFKWAVLGSVGVGLSISLWWAYRKHQQGTLAESMSEKSQRLQAVLGQVIPVLDNAYENAESSTKELLRRTVFDTLSKKMDTADKALIHSIRAEVTKSKSS